MKIQDCVDSCVNSSGRKISEMMDSALDITFETFAKHVDIKRVQEIFGYGHNQGLFLRNDWHVRFYRSKWRGRRCYIMKHSGIEYIYQ